MGIILGVDIGGSTTKIVGLREDGSLLSALRVEANDQLTSLAIQLTLTMLAD